MVRSKLIFSLLVITAFCAVSVSGFAKSLPPQVRGTYGLHGWLAEGTEADTTASVFTGTMSVTGGWAGNAFGDINCNDGDGDQGLTDYLATYFISPGTHQGNIWLVGTGADPFCDDDYFLTLDVQVTNGGGLIKFNFAGNDTAQTGYDQQGVGKMQRIFVGTPSGAYGLRLYGIESDNDTGVVGTGWLTLATDSSGNVMLQNGEIDCNNDGTETASQMFHCSDCVTLNGDGTGMMFLTTSGGDDICNFSKSLVLDFVMVTKGTQILFSTNAMFFVPSTTRTNSGNDMNVTGEMDLQ